MEVFNRKQLVPTDRMKVIWCWLLCFSLNSLVESLDYYGLCGGFIRLSIDPSQTHEHNEIVWRRFNRKDLISKSRAIAPDFRDRMAINTSDWSLIIRKLQENDTGWYEALADWEKTTVAKFYLIVENSVSEPTIKVLEGNSSSGACVASVNCSLDGSWSMFECYQSHCEELHSSPSSINITVTVVDRGIQCHVSNHVSNNRSETLNNTCKSQETLLVAFISSASLLFGALVLSVVLIGFSVKRKSSKVPPQPVSSVSGDMVTAQEHLESIYSMVQKPKASQVLAVHSAKDSSSDSPSAHSAALCSDVLEDAMPQHQEKSLEAKATVHRAAETGSEKISTIYCSLTEI
ncbi:hypothetical protein DNTS_015053 [Danionella cerebrum]|uniref:Immunoglobulin subtype domain-containing protein n=1 Tax=Danionella cerebrum TaxID=2873325 RepID=A0A553Q059_9TELE|nr:hypothetical protein DNTS_015053 [Danionella translucida]